MMEAARDDVQKDITLSDEQESEAVADFEKMKGNLEQSIKDFGNSKDQAENRKASVESDAAEEQETISARQKEIASLEESMANLKKNDCDYVLSNYEDMDKA